MNGNTAQIIDSIMQLFVENVLKRLNKLERCILFLRRKCVTVHPFSNCLGAGGLETVTTNN
jgi:hypothetical protein